MVNAATPNTDRSVASLELELGGRRYPGRLLATEQRASVPVHRIPLRDEDRAIARQLSAAIAALLPWSSLPTGEFDRQTLVTTYIRSLEKLLDCRREAEAFVKLACEINLEFRQTSAQLVLEARDEVLRERLDELRQKAVADWAAVGNILDAQRVSQEVEHLRAQLQANIQDSMENFGEQFLNLLSRLVDANIFGLVEWLPNECCAYHFFKQVVIQTESTQTNTTNRQVVAKRNGASQPDDDGDDDRLGRRVMRTTTTESITATHLHRLSRHEHGVMNAIRTTIRNSKVVMPPGVVRLVNSIPEWLYPFVRVIDGDLFRERIIEQDLKEENWSSSRVTVQDIPIYGPEPAIVIGPYVLTGWGPREVDVEQNRLAGEREKDIEQSHAATQAGHVPMQCVVAAVLSALSVAVAAIVAGKGQGHLIWFATSATAAVAVWQASYGLALLRRHDVPKLQAAFQTTTIVSGTWLLQWLVARIFMPLGWITPVVLAALMVVSKMLWIERRPNMESSREE